MYRYKIIGRSNIGDKIQFYLAGDNRFCEDCNNPDIIFLVGSKESVMEFDIEDYPNAKIVDVSSHKRLISSTNFVDSGNNVLYGIPHITKDYPNYNYIANPGCSAIGSITALTPIINELTSNIILDVKFSKSSLTRRSSFNDKIGIMNVVHPYTHTHQKEVNYYFGNTHNIKMIPSIIDVPGGTSINIHGFKKNKDDNLLNAIYQFYRDNDNIIVSEDIIPEIKDVLNNDKILIYVKEDENNIFINVVLDNLTIGGAYTAYLNAINILKGE